MYVQVLVIEFGFAELAFPNNEMRCHYFQIFRPYARDWIRPLTQLIISGLFTGLNYFVIDVIVTIMSWHQVAIPQVTIAIVNNSNQNGLNHSYLFVVCSILIMDFVCQLLSKSMKFANQCTFYSFNWDLLFNGRNACLT